LNRIAADANSAGPHDSIGVNDEGEGWISLGASSARRDFYWYGRAEEVLRRLHAIAAGEGPSAVRHAFRSEHPG
jgi:hypothetical protein